MSYLPLLFLYSSWGKRREYIREQKANAKMKYLQRSTPISTATDPVGKKKIIISTAVSSINVITLVQAILILLTNRFNKTFFF